MTESLYTWPLVRLVDRPTPDATIRYNFNDRNADAERVVAALDLGSAAFDGDPASQGTRYGYRQPQLTQRIKGSKLTALAAQGQLWRELLRRGNWLEVQLASETKPFWLKTYPTGLPSPGLDRVYVNTANGDPVALPDTWEFDVPFIADNFGLEEEIVLDAVTVTQSPTGDHPMRWVLPAIEGDAPAPLRVSIAPNGLSAAGPGASWLISCIRGSEEMSDPVTEVGTGDGFTAGTGTAAPTDPATGFFGGSYRPVTITAGDGMAERLSGTLPDVPLGRFKALVRVEVDADPSDDKTYMFQLGTAASNSFDPTYADAVPLTVTASATAMFQGWIDLGDFNFPADIQFPEEDYRPLPDSAGPPYISLKIGTADDSDGAAPLRVDAFKLIPVSGRIIDSATTLKAVWERHPPDNGGGLPLVGVFDGESESYWATTGDLLYPSWLSSLAGGFPLADPAAEQNLLILMALAAGPAIGSTEMVTDLGASVEVTVAYHPRKANF